jgi:hypothetical protein
MNQYWKYLLSETVRMDELIYCGCRNGERRSEQLIMRHYVRPSLRALEVLCL